MWQWWNYYQSLIPAGKSTLKINMDETAICLFQGGGKGNVLLAKGFAAVQHAPRSKRRTYMTHVAFVCDDPAVQPLLPHIIIGNERTIGARLLSALRAQCPANVRLLRRPSAWVTGKLCAQIVRWLAAALSPVLGGRQPILLFDAYRAHLCHGMFNACASARIWPVVIPAKMTWLLQPLDTHALLPYKIRLQQLYSSARTRSAVGDVGVEELLQCIFVAIRTVLQGRRWHASFERDGFGASQAGVSDRVLAQLGVSAPFVVPAGRPALAQLQRCFPARARVSEDHVWRAVQMVEGGAGEATMARPRPHRLAVSTRARAHDGGAASSTGVSMATAASPGAAAPKPLAGAVVGPISTRTRARTRAAPFVDLS